MDIVGLFVIFFLSLCVPQIRFVEASYKCGIRKHSFVQLIHGAWEAEEGQWPWHVAVFHKNASGFPEYACGGTLIGEKHILTAAHCVLNRETRYPLSATNIELHFGQQFLSKITEYTQIRDVSEVHVHPKYSTHRNDIAVLVTRLPVNYTDFVIPICMDQQADRDLRNLEDKRGWITGWGTTQSGAISDVLRTASMPVVSYLQCFDDDQILFGNILNPNVFCAGDRNGTSPGTGDSGGGMYFNEGDRWVLKGIVSFAKADEMKKEVDTSKYAVFVNVQRFLSWIKEIAIEPKAKASNGPKRISERECDRFERLAETRKSDGTCANNRYPHTVSVIILDDKVWCNGALINEFHVLTTCRCAQSIHESLNPIKVRTELYGLTDVEKVTCHPRYRENTYNLAVMKLNSSIKLSSDLVPACLANTWTENLYDTLLLTGFLFDLYGVPKYSDSMENKVITQEECNELILSKYKDLQDSNGVLCVINPDRSRAGHWPRLGSPLQSVNSRTCMYTIVGLADVSGRKLTLNDTRVEKYARVSHYLDWIEEIVWNEKPPIHDD